MKYIANCTSLQELGQRTNQEDCLFPAVGEGQRCNRLFIVCDGMGGHERGEVASHIVCKTFSQVLLPLVDAEQTVREEDICLALEKTYEEMDKKAVGDAQNMGTTLTLLALSGDGATIAHIGDSRVYHIRPATREILHRTRDHSLVYDFFEAGLITESEMETHPQRNVITRAIMPGAERRTAPTVFLQTDVQEGDYFYLCSDGMLEQIPDALLLDILAGEGSDTEKIEALRKASSEAKDNHTAHLVQISYPQKAVEDFAVKELVESGEAAGENTEQVAEEPVEYSLPSERHKTTVYGILLAILVLIASIVYAYLSFKDKF